MAADVRTFVLSYEVGEVKPSPEIFLEACFRLHADPAETLMVGDDPVADAGAVFGPNEADALRVAGQIEAGGISVNDAGMTTMVFDTCKSAFRLSGMGPSRMGPSGLTRFLRQKAIYINRGPVVPIQAAAEDLQGTSNLRLNLS